MYTNFSRTQNISRTFHENIDSNQFYLVNYLEKLKALLGKYHQNEIADLLNVTERSIQFWTAEENPKVPFVKTQRKIDELYTKLITEGRSISDLDVSMVEEPETFIIKRQKDKQKSDPFLVPLVPIKAQAGYVRAVDQQTYIDALEKFALPPGVDPMGAIWRYWEIEGESMEPAFFSGDIILTSQVHRMDWENMRNFYLYVIVTRDTDNPNTTSRVLFKRVFCKNPLEWVLISENEDEYPQQLLPVEYIKEVWVFRRSIVSKAPPTKEFKINV